MFAVAQVKPFFFRFKFNLVLVDGFTRKNLNRQSYIQQRDDHRDLFTLDDRITEVSGNNSNWYFTWLHFQPGKILYATPTSTAPSIEMEKKSSLMSFENLKLWALEHLFSGNLGYSSR